MKLALLVSSHEMGGGQTHALWLAEALEQVRGVERILLGRPGGSFEQHAAARGVPFLGLVPGDGFDLVGLTRLVLALRRIGIGLIHTHLNRAALWGTIAGRLLRIPVVATVHGMNRPIYYRFADRVVAVSHAVARHLGRSCPSLQARTRIVPNALSPSFAPDPDRVDRLRRTLGLSPDDRTLLLVAKLHPNKGQRLALDLLARLGPAHRLLLVGEGPDRPVLEQRACDLGLSSRVCLTGHRDDVADLMGVADLVLVPSVEEAFSLTAAEALLCGVPVVAARTGGLVDLVGDSGILLDGRDGGTWASACEAVLADPMAARARAAPARERLLKKHAPDRVLEGLLGIYRELSCES